ncbi:hypothetical protein ACFQZV_00615 [Microbacterium koreense]|uniref:Uncharacterized protein n=1 Tax=Microbacterium koreense TaxID=323761 RepID=A0ABW2ZMN0_9MICO
MGSPDPEMVANLLVAMGVDGSSRVNVAQWTGYAGVVYPEGGVPMRFPPSRDSMVWETTASGLLLLDRVPMRWWHPELDWAVGNDIYGRSLFISGSQSMVQRVVASDLVEAFPVAFDDPVTPEDE